MPLSKRVPEAGAQTRIQRRDLGDRPQAMPSGLEDPARWCQLHRASRGNNSAGEEAPRSKAHSGVAQTRLSGRHYTHSSESRGRPGVIFSGVPMALRATKGDENGCEWSTIVIAGDGRGRNRSGDVEAATEFDPGRVW